MLCRELKGLKEMSGVVEVARARDEGANFILRRAVPFLPKAPAATRDWQEAKRDDYYERSSTLEDKSRCGAPTATAATTTKDDGRAVDPKAKTPPSNGDQQRQAGKDVAHRTVIYFGDSNPRQREDKPNWQPPPPPPSLPEACVRVSSRSNGSPETNSLKNDDEKLRRDSVERNNGDDRDRDAAVTRDTAAEKDPGKAVHEIVVNVSPSREDVLRIEEDESQLEDYWSLPGDTSGFKADWSFVQQWRLRG